MKNCFRRSEKGEIATIITIGTLIFLGVSTLTSSLLIKNKQISSTNASAKATVKPTTKPPYQQSYSVNLPTRVPTVSCVAKEWKCYGSQCMAINGKVFGSGKGYCGNEVVADSVCITKNIKSCLPPTSNIPISTPKPTSAIIVDPAWGDLTDKECANGYKLGECYGIKRCKQCGKNASYNCFLDDDACFYLNKEYSSCPANRPKTTCSNGIHKCCDTNTCYDSNNPNDTEGKPRSDCQKTIAPTITPIPSAIANPTVTPYIPSITLSVVQEPEWCGTVWGFYCPLKGEQNCVDRETEGAKKIKPDIDTCEKTGKKSSDGAQYCCKTISVTPSIEITPAPTETKALTSSLTVKPTNIPLPTKIPTNPPIPTIDIPQIEEDGNGDILITCPKSVYMFGCSSKNDNECIRENTFFITDKLLKEGKISNDSQLWCGYSGIKTNAYTYCCNIIKK